MPKALRDFLGLSFYFWSNETSGSDSEPIHLHISKGKPTSNATKVWVKPDGSLEVAHNKSNLSEKELKKALAYIAANRNEIIALWYQHFGF